MSIGGAVLGATLGYIFQMFSKRYLDAVVGAFSSFLAPYITYILATAIGTSGVLAVVAGGIVSSRIIFRHQTPLRRMIGRVTWDMYVILLNCFIFVLIGSQLDEQTKHMSWHDVVRYTMYALVMTFILFIIRLLWACVKSAISFLRSWRDPKLASHLSQFLRDGVIIGWVGMRGIVSLTAALALPFTRSDGSPLEGRAEVIYMVFCVILFTLILPGLTLGKLISWLNLPAIIPSDATFETRKSLAQVALAEIKRLHSIKTVSDEEHILLYDYFNNRFRLWELITPENDSHKHLEAARKKVVQAQRTVLLEIWEQGHISDKILAQIEHELDAEESQTVRAEL
jgi:CPA1 family monovalent cation:H+ antiporter